MNLKKVGQYIAYKRKEKGLTQLQVAEKLGMSDKSVSKWERGVCLPDVSIYPELCEILGISINEFLAGEDIAQDNIAQKSEENILGVIIDSIQKQKRLKRIIAAIIVGALLVVIAFLIINIIPHNYIKPVDDNSIEMETAKKLYGDDSAYIYDFYTTDKYKSLNFYVEEYHSGEMVSKSKAMSVEFDHEYGSPEKGRILIVPDFDNYVVRIIVIDDLSTVSGKIPILESVQEREHYGRTGQGIEDSIKIRYDEKQPFVALVYDGDGRFSTPDVYESHRVPKENDYVYRFSFMFSKEENI